jgi:phenolic acid decarboxylase
MKILTLFILITLSLFGADALKSAKLLGYETDYKTAIAKAEQEHKMVLLVFVQDPCPYCDRLVHKTLVTPCVQRRMKNYVPVIVDKHGVFPKKLKPPFIPISYVIDPKTEKVTYEIVGAIPYKEYIEDLETEMEFRDVTDD